MTRPFNQQVTCPHCRRSHPAETAFNAWVRNHPDLDSRKAGITRYDCDVLIHRYKFDDTNGVGDPRTVQCLMFIEVKTHGAGLTDAQRDTLGLMNQFLRNRRPNVHAGKIGPHLARHVPLAVAFSRLLNRKIATRGYGGHLLQFSGNDPTDSDSIRWDTRPIDEGQLVALLRFDLDPDWKRGIDGVYRLRPLDLRRRYRSVRQLFGYTCPVCGDEFDRDVYHCPLCDGHHPAGMLCSGQSG